MPVALKWFPPSWIQINTQERLIYIDPAYLKTHFKNYPQKIEFSSWPDPIDYLPEMQGFGRVDVALLPVGGTYTMDSGEAVDAAIAISPRVVIPIHRFDADLQMFADVLETKSDIKVLQLDIGETYNLIDQC